MYNLPLIRFQFSKLIFLLDIKLFLIIQSNISRWKRIEKRPVSDRFNDCVPSYRKLEQIRTLDARLGWILVGASTRGNPQLYDEQ